MRVIWWWLFIILFLHQTTTHIKNHDKEVYVVYHLVPTSNHNEPRLYRDPRQVVYHLVPTSNHNQSPPRKLVYLLFIILFLHQTTTRRFLRRTGWCCLSSCSYIKPQQQFPALLMILVVYHLVPTSNHNEDTEEDTEYRVVYHLVPTSNHNDRPCLMIVSRLFIILFLHQTTTTTKAAFRAVGCLSSCSYIKPQPIAVNLLAISKILRFELLRNGRAGRFLLQIY